MRLRVPISSSVARRHRSLTALALASLTLLPACATGSRMSTVGDGLDLDAVVLYRNGIGYFERSGTVSGDVLSLRVRKDQVDDLLKSLTVVDREGKVVSVSMPLDPASWSRAALATLQPGMGNLPTVLASLAGVDIVVHTASNQRIAGRIVMVEPTLNEPAPGAGDAHSRYGGDGPEEVRDHKLTLMAGSRVHVVRLSQVRSFTFRDGDLAMQLHRTLDAAAGEGMFEQVEVQVRLDAARTHDVSLSYVVEAPMWKPSYRIVLGDGDKALLQAWAVVDNISGEDWEDVRLSLTSGSPTAFRYNLRWPRRVPRIDMTEQGVPRQARVAMGETTFAEETEVFEDAAVPEMTEGISTSGYGSGYGISGTGRGGGGAAKAKRPSRARSPGTYAEDMDAAMAAEPSAPPPAMDYGALRESTVSRTRAREVAGLTQVTLDDPVTVPDGSSTMVAMINEEISGQQVLMYRPGGGGPGFEHNPYRVLLLTNDTDYVLEPGPISVYADGSFVGEGLSEAIGADQSVTIPFSVDPSVSVHSKSSSSSGETRVVKLVRGTLEIETFYRSTTTYEVRTKNTPTSALDVMVRHPRRSGNHELEGRPEGTTEVDGAYLLPMTVAAGETRASLKVVERTPSRTSLSIWDEASPRLLNALLEVSGDDPTLRARLQPIVDARAAIGRIDTEVRGLKRQQTELDQRARETRANLEAIKKDPKAASLRSRLSKRLESFTRDADALGRQIVELNRQRLEHKIELEDLLRDFEYTPASPVNAG